MISTYLSLVAQFHRAFKHPLPDSPTLDDPATNELRPKLIAEELHELRAAIDNDDALEQMDALCDIQYVLSGAVLAFGLREQFDAPTIEMRLAKIPDMDAHLAEMFGLNVMMEITLESRGVIGVALKLRQLQSHLSQLVWVLGFAPVFDEAFATVHANNLGKLWQEDDVAIAVKHGDYTFEPTDGGIIARRADGKIVKPPGLVKVSLERFL